MVPTDSVLAHFVITLKPQYFHCIHHDTPEFFFCEDMYAIFIFYFININDIMRLHKTTDRFWSA